MLKIRYITAAHDTLSYEDDEGRIIVLDRGNPAFDEAEALGPAPYVPPAPTQADYIAALDAHVEATARGRGYNGAAHLASYVPSTVPGWAAEAAAFVKWRDDVWLAAFDTLRRVQAGEDPPTLEELVAGMPSPNWPEG